MEWAHVHPKTEKPFLCNGWEERQALLSCVRGGCCLYTDSGPPHGGERGQLENTMGGSYSRKGRPMKPEIKLDSSELKDQLGSIILEVAAVKAMLMRNKARNRSKKSKIKCSSIS